MNRKEYGRRFPLKPIERVGDRELLIPLDQLRTTTITRQPAWVSGTPNAGPYTVVVGGPNAPQYTYTRGLAII